MPSAQQYNPLAAAPYEGYQAPEPVPAAPSPIPSEAPRANGAVRTSGAIATMADGILRGIMQGRAYAGQKKVIELKAKTDNLQASYNQDAKRLYDLHVAGVPQDSPEYQMAMKAVNGSWGAYMDFMGQHVEQPKKGKSGNKVKDAGQSIMERLHSKDPMEQSQAWYEVAKQSGPPIKYQLAQLNGPQAKLVKDTRDASVEAQNLGVNNKLQYEKDTQRRQELLTKPEGQRTTAENQELAVLTDKLTPVPKPAAERPGEEAKRAADEVVKRMENDPNYEPSDRDKMILHVAGFKDITAATKIHGSQKAGFWADNGTGKPIILTQPQPGHGRGGSASAGGHVKRATPGQFSQVEKDTSAAYAKAREHYNKVVTDIDADDKIPADKKKKMKDDAGNDLMVENKRIAELNSRRTRILGGIPGDDQQHPAAEAHVPEGHEKQSASKGIVRKAAFLHENPDATEEDWDTMKEQLKTQGFEVKE